MTLTICRSPAVDRWITVPEQDTRYCFGCRKHLPHYWQFGFYDEPTYWEPPDHLRCSRCHEERTAFPGTATEGRPVIPEQVLEKLKAALDTAAPCEETQC